MLASTKQGNGNMVCLANSTCDGDMQELTCQINSFLQSVTDNFVPLTPQDDFTRGNDHTVSDSLTISVSDVQEKLLKVNIKKAMGPDNIPNWILRDCAPLLAGPVCAIFNSSLRDGYVPPLWKSANVSPPAKVNPPTLLQKHIRPISLTPVLTKILEGFTCQWATDTISELTDPTNMGLSKTAPLPTRWSSWYTTSSRDSTFRVRYCGYSCWTLARPLTRSTTPYYCKN